MTSLLMIHGAAIEYCICHAMYKLINYILSTCRLVNLLFILLRSCYTDFFQCLKCLVLIILCIKEHTYYIIIIMY